MGSEARQEELYDGDDVDKDTFEQILEMDDEDDEQEFSRGIVFGFFDQVENTFNDMDRALEDKSLDKLSSLGHFLKGSSATLGLTQMKTSCEKIQHLGQKMDATGSRAQSSDDCLEQITDELAKLKTDYKRAERKLRRFYGE